jgi:hypothetical protein
MKEKENQIYHKYGLVNADIFEYPKIKQILLNELDQSKEAIENYT